MEQPEARAVLGLPADQFTVLLASGGAGGGSAAAGTDDKGEATKAQSFTQADVDRIVSERITRERAKYADYDEVKAKAEGAKTLEDRIADLESKGAAAEQRALRAEIAGEFGVSTKRGAKGEPSDAELFLTAGDADTLRKQAERLTARDSERKKSGNYVAREGDTTSTDKADPVREFANELFGRATSD